MADVVVVVKQRWNIWSLCEQRSMSAKLVTALPGTTYVNDPKLFIAVARCWNHSQGANSTLGLQT